MSVLSRLTTRKITTTFILLMLLSGSIFAQEGDQTLPAQQDDQTLPAQQASDRTQSENATTLEIKPDPTLEKTIETNAKADTKAAPTENKSDASTATQANKAEALLPPELTLQHKEDLKHYLPASKVNPLLAGVDDYITLISENMSVNSKGVAILLPDWQQGATNPKAINFLRKTLPYEGWTTISIQPTNKPQNYPSDALTITEQQQENKTIIEQYQVTLASMVNAVLNKAGEYPGLVMIIAQGNNGAMLVDLLSNDNEKANITKQPNALVLLSSYALTNNQLINEANTAFAKKMAYSEYPILDLFLKFDNPIVLNKTKQRLALAQQEMKVYYRQRQLSNTVIGYYPKQELIIQINGWLKTIGL